jgi:hypothetical protein
MGLINFNHIVNNNSNNAIEELSEKLSEKLNEISKKQIKKNDLFSELSFQTLLSKEKKLTPEKIFKIRQKYIKKINEMIFEVYNKIEQNTEKSEKLLQEINRKMENSYKYITMDNVHSIFPEINILKEEKETLQKTLNNLREML